ncbi:MAG TPA: ABC transporter substrate-binding protein [Acidimicrobiales bacterium]|nr:ABC transporter substrate-binding protein [Acidimicrobiales bacterium]
MNTRRTRKWVAGVGSIVAAVTLLATVITVTSATAATVPTSFPRNETLYTSGTQYGTPSSWNPMQQGGYGTGTVGLIYETLFLYNPMNGQYVPWLAKSGTWVNKTQYQITLRPGVTWSDGQPLTANDVVFTLELGRTNAAVPYSNIWTFLKSVQATGTNTVLVTFKTPEYQQWANWLYQWPILPQHIWSKFSPSEVVTGANANPVGTGAYTLLTSNQQEEVLQKNPTWWGPSAGYSVKPQYIVDIVNGANNVVLGQVLSGQIDLSNNFLPGIAKLVSGIGSYGLKTYFAKPPYMLSANTAWLVPNLTKAPMNDVNFRKALAYAISPQAISNVVYGNIVQPANPTGLLPTWNQFINKSVLAQNGFSYNPAKARQVLTAAGYKLRGGYFTSPSGKAINLSLIVPYGWTDWMAAIQLISTELKQAGINVTPKFPQYNDRTSSLQNGTFDLAITNDAQISNTPWTYYQYMFNLPIRKVQNANYNFERYNNPTAWKLVQKLNATPTTNKAAMAAVISQLEKISLTQLPMIPLWYNGMWAQFTSNYWTGWPSSTSVNHYLPVTWRGYWNLTGILMLTKLRPVS